MDLYYFDEGYYTPELGYFQYTASAATNPESFYVAGLQLLADQVGNDSKRQHAKSPSTSAFNQFLLGPGTVISAWYQKDTSAQVQGYLLGNTAGQGFGGGHHVRIIGSTYVELYYNDNAGAAGKFIWSNASPADTEWHQYTILFKDLTYNGQNFIQTVQLFVDGVSQGTKTNSNTQGQTSSSYDMYNAPVLIGRGVNGAGLSGNPNPGANTNDVDTACIAQVGYWPLSSYTDFDITDFYNTTKTGSDPGYLDMGPAGTGTGLPTPKFFASLDRPFGTSIIGVNSTTGSAQNYTEFDSTWYCAVGLASTGLHGRFSLSVDAINTQLFVVALNSTFTQSASAIKQIGITANLNTTATQSATGVRIRPFALALTAFYTELTAVAKIARSPITFTTAFTLTCDAIAGKLASANLDLNATLSVSYIVAKRASATLTSAFTQTAINRRLSETLVPLTSTATQSAVNTRRRQTLVGLNTAAAQTVEYLVISQVNANLASSFALVATAKKVAVAAIALNTAFTHASAPNRIRRTAVVLQGIYAELADGYIIHIDPYLTYAIAQETRNFLITTDVRNYLIAQETRARQIPAETRIYAVDSDTRVNTIIGSAL